EKGLFLKRMGTLLQEGYSMKDALIFLSKIEKGPSINCIQSIQEGMLLGNSFHLELDKLGFPTKVYADIYIASHYRNYRDTIMRSATSLLQELEHKKTLKPLLTYSLLLLLFLLGVLLKMRFLILHHMQQLFGSFATTTEIYSNWLAR